MTDQITRHENARHLLRRNIQGGPTPATILSTDDYSVLYALILRKAEALYVKLSEMLKFFVPPFTPASAITDFEEASVSAFRRFFGNVNVMQRLLVSLRAVYHKTSAEIRTKGRLHVCAYGNRARHRTLSTGSATANYATSFAIRCALSFDDFFR